VFVYQVVIKVSSRGKSKHVTLVSGLEAHLPPGETLKSVAKAMAVRFACSASVGVCVCVLCVCVCCVCVCVYCVCVVCVYVCV
jgi:hypothetical protein